MGAETAPPRGRWRRRRLLRLFLGLAALYAVGVALSLVPLLPFLAPLVRWRPNYSDFHTGSAGLEQVVTLPKAMRSTRWVHDSVSKNRFLPWGATIEWWVIAVEVAEDDWRAVDSLLGGVHGRAETYVNAPYVPQLFSKDELHGWAATPDYRNTFPTEPGLEFQWLGETLEGGRQTLAITGPSYDVAALHPGAGLSGGTVRTEKAVRVGRSLILRITLDHTTNGAPKATEAPDR